MNLYTLLAFGLVVYIVRDMLRTWTKARAQATVDASVRGRVETLASELASMRDEQEAMHAAMQQELDALRAEQDRMTTRMEHVETIVTHEAWDRWQDAQGNPSIDNSGINDSGMEGPPPPQADASASEIARHWARRLRP